MESLVTPEQLRREGQRQRRPLVVLWLISVVIIAGALVVAGLDGSGRGFTIGAGATLVIVVASTTATITARREAGRWEGAAATGLGRQWPGLVTGFTTNTYGIRWGVEVAVDSSPGTAVRLRFRGRDHGRHSLPLPELEGKPPKVLGLWKDSHRAGPRSERTRW